MRILVVSDTHGRESGFYEVLEREKDLDAVIHCGDSVGGAARMEEKSPCPFYTVAGNCDFGLPHPLEQELEIGGKRIWVTHGHMFGVNFGIDTLLAEAQDFGYDVVLYGHTHRPQILSFGGITVVNPGSLTQPRQEDRKPTYAMLWLNGDGSVNAEIRYL